MKAFKKILCLVLALAAVLSFATACGDDKTLSDFSEYYGTRSTEGRDISYAKITVESYGEIVVLLDATTAPVTVANFKKLVSEGFYDGLTFHRIIQGFMIQGGCPNGDGTGDADEDIKGEFSSNGYDKNDIKHLRGTLSMARGDDKNSASCQFFICDATASNLDGNYAAFGYVVKGLFVVDEIARKCSKYGDDNGAIENKVRQPVIESIVLLDSFNPAA